MWPKSTPRGGEIHTASRGRVAGGVAQGIGGDGPRMVRRLLTWNVDVGSWPT